MQTHTSRTAKVNGKMAIWLSGILQSTRNIYISTIVVAHGDVHCSTRWFCLSCQCCLFRFRLRFRFLLELHLVVSADFDGFFPFGLRFHLGHIGTEPEYNASNAVHFSSVRVCVYLCLETIFSATDFLSAIRTPGTDACAARHRRW